MRVVIIIIIVKHPSNLSNIKLFFAEGSNENCKHVNVAIYKDPYIFAAFHERRLRKFFLPVFWETALNMSFSSALPLVSGRHRVCH
jgi:hypothetical protein